MIEGHGTGTQLGDRTELHSLAATYGTGGRRVRARCWVRSNPTSATPRPPPARSGLAKVLLAAEHAAVPPTLHVDEPSHEIDWEKAGFTASRQADTMAGGGGPADGPRCRRSG